LERFYEPEYDVRFFAYDWRLSNTISADKLAEFIDANGYDEVILVAHSMGGIVSSLYIEGQYGGQYNEDVKVDKLITLGTPYLGSPKVFGTFETGEFADGIAKLVSWDNEVFKTLIPNMACGYELLPVEGYFENGNYYLQAENGLGFTYNHMSNFISQRPWYNSTLATAASNIQKTLNSFYNRIKKGDIDAYIIIGYNVKTLTCFQWKDNKINDIKAKYDGDGTVPLISATLNFAKMDREPYFVDGIEHQLLPSDGKCIQLVKNIINGNGDNNFGEDNPESFNYNCEGAVARNNYAYNYKGDITKIIVRCPVALEVYSKDGTLLGKITPDGIETDSEHFYDFYALGDNNETKIAFVDGEVDIVITGTGEGTMDLAVERYNGDELAASVTYDDVPITQTTVIETTSDITGNTKLNLRESENAEAQEILPDTLTVEIRPGDIDRNGEITPEDYNILVDYFSGHPVDVSITPDTADLNGDTLVTRADAMILARYLAKWPGYAEKYFQ